MQIIKIIMGLLVVISSTALLAEETTEVTETEKNTYEEHAKVVENEGDVEKAPSEDEHEHTDSEEQEEGEDNDGTGEVVDSM